MSLRLTNSSVRVMLGDTDYIDMEKKRASFHTVFHIFAFTQRLIYWRELWFNRLPMPNV